MRIGRLIKNLSAGLTGLVLSVLLAAPAAAAVTRAPSPEKGDRAVSVAVHAAPSFLVRLWDQIHFLLGTAPTSPKGGTGNGGSSGGTSGGGNLDPGGGGGGGAAVDPFG